MTSPSGSILQKFPLPKKTRRRGRRRLDETAKALAPIVAEIRKEGYHGIADIAMRLEDKGNGVLSPNGEFFARETTRQILKRIKTLGLGEGPRSVSEALSARHQRKRGREIALSTEQEK
jgi:hypothetical protein